LTKEYNVEVLRSKACLKPPNHLLWASYSKVSEIIETVIQPNFPTETKNLTQKLDCYNLSLALLSADVAPDDTLARSTPISDSKDLISCLSASIFCIKTS
jgi:hypothetical protein